MLPPHPCPHLYEQQFPNSLLFANSSWYSGGTIMYWNDRERTYRGLIRGDGLVLSFEDKRPAPEHPSRVAHFITKPCKVKYHFYWDNLFRFQNPFVKHVIPYAFGSSSGLFVQGQTNDYDYK